MAILELILNDVFEITHSLWRYVIFFMTVECILMSWVSMSCGLYKTNLRLTRFSLLFFRTCFIELSARYATTTGRFKVIVLCLNHNIIQIN